MSASPTWKKFNIILRPSTPDSSSDWRSRSVAARKALALRIDEKTLAAMQRWAYDDLRSLNAQFEFVLRESLRAAGRLPKQQVENDD